MLSAPSNAFASGEIRIIITNKEKADAEMSLISEQVSTNRVKAS